MEAPRDNGQKPPTDAAQAPDNANRTIGQIALGLGRLRVTSVHEHRLEWEREYRSHP